MSLITTELDAKRLSLLGEFIPNAKRIAVLRDPAVSAADHIPQLEKTAHSLGVALEIVEANRPDAIEAAVQLARSHGVEALSVLASPMLNGAARSRGRPSELTCRPCASGARWRRPAAWSATGHPSLRPIA